MYFFVFLSEREIGEQSRNSWKMKIGTNRCFIEFISKLLSLFFNIFGTFWNWIISHVMVMCPTIIQVMFNIVILHRIWQLVYLFEIQIINSKWIDRFFVFIEHEENNANRKLSCYDQLLSLLEHEAM